MGTICPEKEVAEMEVKGVAEGEQVCTAFQKYFWFKFESRVNVDPFVIPTHREVVNDAQYELIFIEQKVGEPTLRKLTLALPHKGMAILNQPARKSISATKKSLKWMTHAPSRYTCQRV